MSHKQPTYDQVTRGLWLRCVAYSLGVVLALLYVVGALNHSSSISDYFIMSYGAMLVFLNLREEKYQRLGLKIWRTHWPHSVLFATTTACLFLLPTKQLVVSGISFFWAIFLSLAALAAYRNTKTDTVHIRMNAIRYMD
ncbi:hypothetical protein [Algirhabdus cladophorae]|uniref:hypothetical protein n=1 Tax=Algirhabdus cladophorae TaxID=3377108 RepID=UPI003B84797D